MKHLVLCVGLVWGTTLTASASALSWSKLDGAVGRPEVVLVVMLLAIFGIIGEVSHPGRIVPGIVGGLAFVGLVYTTTLLPLHLVGFAVIALALILFAAEACSAAYGTGLGGGIACFFVGARLLFEQSPTPLPLVWLVSATLLTGTFFAFVVDHGLRAQFQPVRVDRQTLLGQRAPALTRIDAISGKVFLAGGYWNAISDVPVEPGQPVEIVGLGDATLQVRPTDRIKPPAAPATTA